MKKIRKTPDNKETVGLQIKKKISSDLRRKGPLRNKSFKFKNQKILINQFTLTNKSLNKDC